MLAPDLPGHGASAVGAPMDAEHMNRWLGELIEGTCEEPSTVMGHLLGGAIAARFAAARPDRLFRYRMRDLEGLREEMDGQMERLEEYALDGVRDDPAVEAPEAFLDAVRPTLA